MSWFESSNMRGHTSGSRPIISQIICTGHLGGDLLDELDLALLAHVVDDARGPALDLLDELRDHPRA